MFLIQKVTKMSITTAATTMSIAVGIIVGIHLLVEAVRVDDWPC